MRIAKNAEIVVTISALLLSGCAEHSSDAVSGRDGEGKSSRAPVALTEIKPSSPIAQTTGASPVVSSGQTSQDTWYAIAIAVLALATLASVITCFYLYRWR